MSALVSRRRLLQAHTGLGLTAGVLPLLSGCAGRKKEQVYRVGAVHVHGSDNHDPVNLQAVRAGLKERGYEAGRNLIFDYRNVLDSRAAEATVRELADAGVDVTLTWEPLAALAAKAANIQTPIVIAEVLDPVDQSLVQSITRPGGNITGIYRETIYPKWVELFPEVVPGLTRLFLFHRSAPKGLLDALPAARQAAAAAKLDLITQQADTSAELAPVFAAVTPGRGDGVMAVGAIASTIGPEVRRWASANRLPLAGPLTSAEDDALFDYRWEDIRSAQYIAEYIDRILRGARPADLPLQVDDTFALTINLRQARELDIAVPPSVVARATKVTQ